LAPLDRASSVTLSTMVDTKSRRAGLTELPYTDITYRIDDSVAHIELNRPESLNSWTPDMGRQLLSAVRRAAQDDSVRAVLITGAGKAFSAGADVKVSDDSTAEDVPDITAWLRDIYNPVMLTIRSAPKPFVAAVQGACAGLGVSLALACDLVVAAENAYFLLAFIHVGVMPDGGATAFLPERVGLARANELCMLGERLPAPTAREWGMVNAIHPADELEAAAFALVRRLAAAPTVALASMKRALTAAAQSALTQQMDMEAEMQQLHATTADYAEGRAAFAEKRRPVFKGR
jgi:2-(1,2-epoxy-1,2-dihydrophenyl)acetyl-CoA isomerase